MSWNYKISPCQILWGQGLCALMIFCFLLYPSLFTCLPTSRHWPEPSPIIGRCSLTWKCILNQKSTCTLWYTLECSGSKIVQKLSCILTIKRRKMEKKLCTLKKTIQLQYNMICNKISIQLWLSRIEKCVCGKVVCELCSLCRIMYELWDLHCRLVVFHSLINVLIFTWWNNGLHSICSSSDISTGKQSEVHLFSGGINDVSATIQHPRHCQHWQITATLQLYVDSL